MPEAPAPPGETDGSPPQPPSPRREQPAASRRLGAALLEGVLIETVDSGSSIRELLGEQDVAAKTFLKNLTRFHRLKRALDGVAQEILSAFLRRSVSPRSSPFGERPPGVAASSPSPRRRYRDAARRSPAFLNEPRFQSRAPPAPLRQLEGDLATQLARGAEAANALDELIGKAVRAAGLSPTSQPNTFIEISLSRDDVYTAATMGPLKTKERCAEKAANEYPRPRRNLPARLRGIVVVAASRTTRSPRNSRVVAAASPKSSVSDDPFSAE